MTKGRLLSSLTCNPKTNAISEPIKLSDGTYAGAKTPVVIETKLLVPHQEATKFLNSQKAILDLLYDPVSESHIPDNFMKRKTKLFKNILENGTR
jgi:hypothetical protein